MNDLIRQLALRSGAMVDLGTNPATGITDRLTMSDAEIERFANHIVDECCKIVQARSGSMNNPNDCLAVLDIKELFGVK